jgi:hypothetical protein
LRIFLKTLLISDSPPNKKTSGSLLTWHLSKNFDENTLVAYFLLGPGIGAIQPEFQILKNVKWKSAKKGNERRFTSRWIPKKLGFTVAYVVELYRKHFQIPKYLKDVLAFAKENDVDRIWIILQGQTMIYLAEQLIREGSLPVHVQVWDSPNWWIKAHQIDRFSARMIRASFQFALQSAKSFASPSFHMSKLHFEKYAKKSQTFIGITPSEFMVDTPKSKDPSKIIIGLAGQTYAANTLAYLIFALDSMYWEFEGKKIEIHYWGYSDFPAHRTRIIRMGYINQDQLTTALSGCDLLYCPYWFERDYQEEAETSFPSKLTTYLSSGTLVFFHGPAYSSPVSLLLENKAGICCFSTDVEGIKMKIRQAVLHANRDQIISNAKKLVADKLSEEFLQNSFKEFMDIKD